MESEGRTPEERRAAAEARARARRDEPPATGEEELIGGSGPRGADARARDREARHPGIRRYGGPDVYLRRRLLALAAVIVLIIAIFLLVVGC
jgi:hypothetical protein